MHTQEIIATHPHVQGNTNDVLIRAIDALADCALTCTSCADACLGEPDVTQLTQCIRLDLDCVDVCAATAALATRRTGSNDALLKAMLELCANACDLCADEAAKHTAQHEHCRISFYTCRQCAQACNEAADSITPGGGLH